MLSQQTLLLVVTKRYCSSPTTCESRRAGMHAGLGQKRTPTRFPRVGVFLADYLLCPHSKSSRSMRAIEMNSLFLSLSDFASSNLRSLVSVRIADSVSTISIASSYVLWGVVALHLYNAHSHIKCDADLGNIFRFICVTPLP